MNIHKIGQAVIVLVEDVIVDRGSANHFVPMECQKSKNGKFASRQNDREAIGSDRFSTKVDYQRSHCNLVGAESRRPTNNRSDASKQFDETVRLHEIVIRPLVQANDSVGNRIASRQQ